MYFLCSSTTSSKEGHSFVCALLRAFSSFLRPSSPLAPPPLLTCCCCCPVPHLMLLLCRVRVPPASASPPTRRRRRRRATLARPADQRCPSVLKRRRKCAKPHSAKEDLAQEDLGVFDERIRRHLRRQAGQPRQAQSRAVRQQSCQAAGGKSRRVAGEAERGGDQPPTQRPAPTAIRGWVFGGDGPLVEAPPC